MIKKDLTDAYNTIRKTNHTIPDVVLDFMLVSACEKLKRMERIQSAYPKEVDAYGQIKTSSGHSFTEGMNYHQTATIGEQIEFMETVKKDLVVPFKFKLEIAAIINTLRTSQVFEHQRMLIQNIDFEKVIGDLIQEIADAGLNRSNGVPIPAIQNAEAALGMIDAFKQKSSPPDWVKNFEQVKSVSWADYPKEMQKKKRDELLGQVKIRLQAYIPSDTWKLAEAILFAIEEMDKLKSNSTAVVPLPPKHGTV